MLTRKAASESPIAEMSHAKSAGYAGAAVSATHMAAETAIRESTSRGILCVN
jgi:hypothetical protein